VPEPGLEGERGCVGHGGRPQGKTGLDKHGRRGSRRVRAKGSGLLPAIRIAVVILMGDGTPVGGALEAPDTLPGRDPAPVRGLGSPEPIPVPDMIPTKPLPIGVVEIHPSVSSGGTLCQVLGLPVPAYAEQNLTIMYQPRLSPWCAILASSGH